MSCCCFKHVRPDKVIQSPRQVSCKRARNQSIIAVNAPHKVVNALCSRSLATTKPTRHALVSTVSNIPKKVALKGTKWTVRTLGPHTWGNNKHWKTSMHVWTIKCSRNEDFQAFISLKHFRVLLTVFLQEHHEATRHCGFVPCTIWISRSPKRVNINLSDHRIKLVALAERFVLSPHKCNPVIHWRIRQ